MKRTRGRKLRLSRIRKFQSYYIDEVTRLLGVATSTVRHWIRNGLHVITTDRCYLIHGGTLYDFLKARQTQRKRACGPGEFYCLRCRAPRKPFGLMVEIVACNDLMTQIRALCETCDAKMNRRCSVAKLAETLKPFDDITLLSPRLIECLPPSLNCHSKEVTTDGEI